MEDLKELKVLLVEDETKLANLLKNAIGDYFYSFTIANNGKNGIEKFLKIEPDIVITDIMMPELTGLEMANELKKINPKLPIIILSAHSEKERLLNAIDVGVVKYFIKPFDPDELLEYIYTLSSTIDKKLIELEGGFTFNSNTKRLYKKDKFIALTKRETAFISLLLGNKDEPIDDKTIKHKLWEDENVSDERLRTFIKRLRIKTYKTLIKNIVGQGYRIALA